MTPHRSHSFIFFSGFYNFTSGRLVPGFLCSILLRLPPSLVMSEACLFRVNRFCKTELMSGCFLWGGGVSSLAVSWEQASSFFSQTQDPPSPVTSRGDYEEADLMMSVGSGVRQQYFSSLSSLAGSSPGDW